MSVQLRFKVRAGHQVLARLRTADLANNHRPSGSSSLPSLGSLSSLHNYHGPAVQTPANAGSSLPHPTLDQTRSLILSKALRRNPLQLLWQKTPAALVKAQRPHLKMRGSRSGTQRCLRAGRTIRTTTLTPSPNYHTGSSASINT